MADAPQQGRRLNRPQSVTIVTLGVFLLGLANGWRTFGITKQADLLRELDPTLDPRIRAAATFCWMMVFLFLAVGLWQRRSFSRWAVPAALLVYSLFQFCLSLLFEQNGGSADELVLMSIFFGLAVAVSIWVLNREQGRSYFLGR